MRPHCFLFPDSATTFINQSRVIPLHGLETPRQKWIATDPWDTLRRKQAEEPVQCSFMGLRGGETHKHIRH